jgi:diaminopimelate decarboxylase
MPRFFFRKEMKDLNTKELLKASETYGSPLYVYHGERIEFQYHRLKNAFHGVNVHLHYAMKALNNINILKILKNLGSGLDAVSIQEVHLGLRAGFKPEEIMYTPNCVSFEEIKEAVELGVIINIDTISILDQFGHEYGSSVPCCLRLNPHIMAGGHSNISVGHIDSKFGISIHQLRHVQRVVETHKIKVNGLHMHTGSDILDAEVFLRGAELLFEAAFQFPDLEFMDFGSGFKVAYKEGDIVTDIEQIGAKISTAFTAFCAEYGKPLALWFEPGKFIVSEAGSLLVSANVIKTTTSTVFIGVNSGQNHLIRPMFYDAYHHIENVSNPKGTPRLYSVVGYICETDTLGYDRQIAEVREGDILRIKNAGAYAFTMSNNYNARLRPAEVLFYKGQMHLIRKMESLEDIYRNEVLVLD